MQGKKTEGTENNGNNKMEILLNRDLKDNKRML